MTQSNLYPHAVYPSLAAWLADGGDLPDGTPVLIYSAQSGEVVLHGLSKDTPGYLARSLPWVPGDALADGEGATVSLDGTGPATLTWTYGDGYVDLLATGTNADDQVTIALDVFGSGGSGESWISYFGACVLVDPNGTDSPASGTLFGVGGVNPANDRYAYAAIRYDGTKWDRYQISDEGSGDTESSYLTSQSIAEVHWLSLHLQGRDAVRPNAYGEWSVPGAFNVGETGLAATDITTSTSDATQRPAPYLLLRPKAGSITVRLYAVSARSRINALDPSA